MIFGNNSGSIALVFNPLIPSFLTRKSLGTPVPINKLNPIFRIKKIEKVNEVLSLHSVSRTDNNYLDIVQNNLRPFSQYSNDYSDNTQNNLSTLSSQYSNDYSDNAQNNLNIFSSQYANDYLDNAQNNLNIFSSQYANDYLDNAQNNISLFSQYANDYLDNAQNNISPFSQYTGDYVDVAQNNISPFSQYTGDYSDNAQNNLSTLSSQYTGDYLDITQNNLSTLSSQYTGDYSDIVHNNLSTLSSQFTNVRFDIVQNNLSTLSSEFSNIQFDVVDSNVNTSLIRYSEYLDNDVVDQTTKLTGLHYEFINLFLVNNEIKISSLNFEFVNSNKIFESNFLKQLSYTPDEFSKKIVQESNLISLTSNFFNTSVNETTNLVDLEYSSDINNRSTLTSSLQSLSYENIKIDQVSSSIHFKPYSTASNVTFNSDSLVNYVKQINVIYYMSGSVLTQSIIDYTQDLVFQVIGNSNTGLYQTNFDYNTPYRASFITKNWPVYQRNTSSLWYLPVILNCSNSERKISATSGDWVEAVLENGSSFTDQYGFSIDI